MGNRNKIAQVLEVAKIRGFDRASRGGMNLTLGQTPNPRGGSRSAPLQKVSILETLTPVDPLAAVEGKGEREMVANFQSD